MFESTLEMYSCLLQFFGYSFNYLSAAQSDINHLKLIFRNFLPSSDLSCSEPGQVFLMSDNPSEPYIHHVLGPFQETKQIYRKHNSAWEKWTSKNTPLPPFTIPPLAGKFLVLHGCCIQIDQKTIAFCGPSFAGKSSLLLESVYQGALAISDDLVIIEFISDGKPLVWRYPKPVGIRQPTLSLLPWLPERFYQIPDNCKLSFPAHKGRPATTITHLDDIFSHKVFLDAQKHELDAIYFLNRSFSGVSSLTGAEKLAYLLSNTCNSGFSRARLASLGAQMVARIRMQELGNLDLLKAAHLLLFETAS